MTHSSLTDKIVSTNLKSSRNGTTVDTFLIHHQASTNDNATINMMISGSRTVSANYTISNEGRVTCVVGEEYRAWTSGSTTDGGKGAQWDRRSITVEIENETGSPDWKISDAALNKAAALLKDLRKRYNIVNVLGHRDLYQKYGASYPTYCPGPNTVAAILSREGGAVDSGPASGGGEEAIQSTDYAFGLNTAAQKAVQSALQKAQLYSGIVDGVFGPLSVASFQTWLKRNGYLASGYTVDGVPGPVYGKAVQTLAAKFGYSGPIDGYPGSNTSAAIVKWAATITSPTESGGQPSWSYWEPTGELAKRVQKALKGMGRYSGPIDGVFGVNTRKGVQQTCAKVGYSGPIDGVPGENTCYYIQVYAQKFGDYTGPIDKAPRENSWRGLALGLERK